MNQPLYHYCSLESFFQIIQNKTLRLTDISQSNDSLELKHGANSFFQSYKEITKEIPSELAKINFIINCSLVYVFCLSEKGDALSQWRGYGDDGFGVSVGLI